AHELAFRRRQRCPAVALHLVDDAANGGLRRSVRVLAQIDVGCAHDAFPFRLVSGSWRQPCSTGAACSFSEVRALGAVPLSATVRASSLVNAYTASMCG